MKDSQPYGLILSGGKSSRMGSDKSLIVYHEKPQCEYLFELLTAFCSKVFTSCRKDQEVPERFHPLYDHYDYPGPINGILSAFHAYPDSSWLIIAVDMPLVDENVLKVLIENRDKKKVATCFKHLVEGSFPEPLLTIWEPLAYPLLLSYVNSGKISPRGFLEMADVKSIPVPDERILLNINFPEDRFLFNNSNEG